MTLSLQMITLPVSIDAQHNPEGGSRVRVLLVCCDPKRRRTLAAACFGAADDVDLTDAFDDGFDPSRYHAVIIDNEATVPRPSALLGACAHGPPPVVVLINTQADTQLLPWIERIEAVHVIQYEHVQRFNDLHVTLRKITSGDIFGIGKYFAWGSRERVFSLQRSDERGAVFEALESFSKQLCVQGRIRSLAATVLDEFVSNAFYNAPVDASGAFRFRAQNRAEAVSLRDDERISVRFCADGRRLGIAVIDPFGSLQIENIRTTLIRGLRRGEQSWASTLGGAGLGFFCAFESLSHMVVNVAPGRCTELIGILTLRDNFRDFLGSGRSFNVFTTPPGDATR